MNRTLPILFKRSGVYSNDAIGSQSKYTTENFNPPGSSSLTPTQKVREGLKV